MRHRRGTRAFHHRQAGRQLARRGRTTDVRFYCAGTSALGKPAIACAAVSGTKSLRRSPPASSGPGRERAGARRPAAWSRGTPSMIPITALQATAETLMAKAAIEIPKDYLGGLRECANTETGDLSAFVIQAMLENYEAAKEDRRAMCGDTGVPRWYVKIGNEARVEGGPIALEAALRRATANATHAVPLRPNRVHPLWATTTTTIAALERPKSNIPSIQTPIGSISPPCTRAACLAPTTGDVPWRWYRRHQTLLPRHAHLVWTARPCLSASDRRAIGLGGSKDICMVLGKQAACLRTVGSRNPDTKVCSPWKPSLRASATPSAWAPWALWVRPWSSTAISRLPLPHRRHADQCTHVLPLFAPRHGTRVRRWPR